MGMIYLFFPIYFYQELERFVEDPPTEWEVIREYFFFLADIHVACDEFLTIHVHEIILKSSNS